MSKSKKVQAENVETPAAVVADVTPEVAAPAAKHAGRKPLPRDENGEIVRPDGWVKPVRGSSKAAPVIVALTYANGQLTAEDGRIYAGGQWHFNGYNVESATAELTAALAAVDKAQAVLASLKLTPEIDPVKLIQAGAGQETVFAAYEFSRKQAAA